jgi:hypothetical protein
MFLYIHLFCIVQVIFEDCSLILITAQLAGWSLFFMGGIYILPPDKDVMIHTLTYMDTSR